MEKCGIKCIVAALENWSLHEGLITALAIGGFFIIIGLVFALTPGISSTDCVLLRFNNSNLPVWRRNFNDKSTRTSTPAEHAAFYTAVMNFLLGVGILQIIILVLRFYVKSPIRRIAETVGNLVFWLGAAVMANVFLIAGTLNGWFQFWSTLIVLIGASLIARFFVHLTGRQYGAARIKEP